ncbi:MAG TPA: GNAT family N-acetyltransferase [Myxococcaceae bacterium]|nr:GNAT family N-acetyltransferase [Myxococcaceae bacterium]
MALRIQRCSARRAAELRGPLVELLRDAVDTGASVGFLPPLGSEEAGEYWHGVEQALTGGRRELLVADLDGRVAGTVQLELAAFPNGRHRAEVLKLLVHGSARRRGIGRALMREAEEVARSHGRTLLVLDTLQGHPAEHLYLALGYVRVGAIPGYARVGSGALEPTVVYYRTLP